MWRGILSIFALLLIFGSSVVIASIWIIPDTFLHGFVPVLKPLHEAIACEAGETMEYEYLTYEGTVETQFRCVNDAGTERNVDSIVERPAYYALGTLCLGGLLLLGPFISAMRRELSGEGNARLQRVMSQQLDAVTQTNLPILNATGQQQLDALEKLWQQKLITQDGYEAAKKQIFDTFRSS